MKKLAVSVLTLVAVIFFQFSSAKAFAANISDSTARQLGAYYLSVMSGQKQAEPSQISLAYTFYNADMTTPAAYIYNIKGQGYVIVAGSDYCYPILGYSTEGMIDPQRIAPGMLEFFDAIVRKISYAQDFNTPIFEKQDAIQNEWNELYNHTLAYAAPKATNWLCDEAWGQGDNTNPTYNLLCPSGTTSDGQTEYCYTGCVATAMAMIMHYWQYPHTGKGYIGYNCYINEGTDDQAYYGYIDINLAQQYYDYSLMPNKLTSSSTSAQINETAKLNYHVGVSVKMGYGFDGSGAQSSDVPTALKNKFKYADAKYVSRSSYSDDNWMQLIYNEIDSLRPIYYSAYSASGSGRDAGGHAFILDGVHPSQTNKVHFNWGWDGSPNSWNDVRNGDLSVPSSYGGYNFNQYQAVVYRITPPADSCIHTPSSDGIVEKESAEVLPAFPNPATSTVTIPYELQGQNGLTLDIYTIDGRMIESKQLYPETTSTTVNVSSYPKGLYIYRIGSSASKFVVR